MSGWTDEPMQRRRSVRTAAGRVDLVLRGVGDRDQLLGPLVVGVSSAQASP